MFYTLQQDDIKTHYCDSWPLTQQVFDNLYKRFGKPLTVGAEDVKEYIFDPGGTVFHSNEKFTISAGALTISGFVCHWDLFRDTIYSLTPLEKYDNKYMKLHGQRSILCISPVLHDQLMVSLLSASRRYDGRCREMYSSLEKVAV